MMENLIVDRMENYILRNEWGQSSHKREHASDIYTADSHTGGVLIPVNEFGLNFENEDNSF